MIYSLKLLFFVLVAGGLAHVLVRSAFKELLPALQYRRAWFALLVVTCCTFLALHAMLLFLLLTIAALVTARYLGKGNEGYLNTFLLFLLPLPPIGDTLGGLENLNYILRLEPARLLSIVLLTVPAIRLLFRRRDRDQPSMRSLDIAMLLVQTWSWLMIAPSSSWTNLARTVTTSLYDVLIPYYVVTRVLRTPSQLRESASYLMLGLILMGAVACVESIMQRNLYSGLQWIYGLRWDLTPELRRGSFLRVESSAGGGPIILGFCMVFGMALWSWLGGQWASNRKSLAVYLILAFALASSWSRGPWLGAVVLGVSLVLQRWMTPRTFGVVVVVTILAAVFVKASGGDEAVMAGLGKIFGASENELSTIVYRRDLLDATIALIKQSPWTGVPNYERALANFRQGEGIIDIVNTYLVVMINGGVVGLILFLIPFLLLIGKLIGRDGSGSRPARVIFGNFAPVFISLILTMLFLIFTVSSVGAIPYLLGLGIALSAAWLRLGRNAPVVVQKMQEPAYEYGGIRLPLIATRPGTYR